LSNLLHCLPKEVGAACPVPWKISTSTYSIPQLKQMVIHKIPLAFLLTTLWFTLGKGAICPGKRMSVGRCTLTRACPKNFNCIHGYCCPKCAQVALRPGPDGFRPSCTPDGNYEPVQCDARSGECWCVTEKGQEIEGSRKTAPSTKMTQMMNPSRAGLLPCDMLREQHRQVKPPMLGGAEMYNSAKVGRIRPAKVCRPQPAMNMCSDRCQADTDCAQLEQCCYNGCGRQCQIPPSEEFKLQPNLQVQVQPQPYTISGEFPSQSLMKGGEPSSPMTFGQPYPDTSAMQRPAQIVPVVTEKPGYCPAQRAGPPPLRVMALGSPHCQMDVHCPDTKKCCETPVGRRCLAVQESVTSIDPYNIKPGFATETISQSGPCPPSGGAGFQLQPSGQATPFRQLDKCQGDFECPAGMRCCRISAMCVPETALDVMSASGTSFEKHPSKGQQFITCDRQDEEYSNCVPTCQVGCDNLHTAAYCTQTECKPGCVCRIGYVRLHSKDPTSACVPKAQCQESHEPQAPPTTQVGVASDKAVISLTSKNGQVSGVLSMEEFQGRTEVTGTVNGLPEGRYELHVHENGDISEPCTSAGPFFGQQASGSFNSFQQASLIGMADADSAGHANVSIETKQFTLSGPTSVVGRTLVFHRKGAPGFGTPVLESNGIACGVIGLA
ncbi:Superoxide dismutase [Cu-Zn], partial [Trichinella murrelli]